MAMIKAKHYGETEARLARDPIILAMAQGLADVPRRELVHDEPHGGPRFEFMQRANAEYRERGGTDGGHIGAVATALLMALDSGVVKRVTNIRIQIDATVPDGQDLTQLENKISSYLDGSGIDPLTVDIEEVD